jgi:protein disulfide-isomerase
VLVELDFPQNDKDLAEKNQPLAEQYQIDGFPTVVLLDSEGKEFTRFTASKFPEVEAFLKHLDQALENKDLD